MLTVKKLPKFKMFQISLQLHTFVAYIIKIKKNNFGGTALTNKGNY